MSKFIVSIIGAVGEILESTLKEDSKSRLTPEWFHTNKDFVKKLVPKRLGLFIFLSIPGIFVLGFISSLLMSAGNDILFLLQFPFELAFLTLLTWLLIFIPYLIILMSGKGDKVGLDQKSWLQRIFKNMVVTRIIKDKDFK